MQNSSRVELPIVPLLDISFQLMFFLVITFSFGGAEGQFAMSLPSSKISSPLNAPMRSQANNGVDLPSEVVVSVRTEAHQLHLIIRDGARIMEASDSSELAERLTKVRAQPAADRTSLKIDADGQVKYSRLIEVLDTCQRAGFNNISFAMPDGR